MVLTCSFARLFATVGPCPCVRACVRACMRAGFANDTAACWVQLLDRVQSQLQMWRLVVDRDFHADEDPMDTNTYTTFTKERSELLIEEKTDTWINVHDLCHWLPDNRSFIWASERSGYRHLELVVFPPPAKTPVASLTSPTALLSPTLRSRSASLSFGPSNSTSPLLAGAGGALASPTLSGGRASISLASPSALGSVLSASPNTAHPFAAAAAAASAPFSEGCTRHVLTSGAWQVDKNDVWVHPDAKLVFFVGFADTHLQRHLYYVSYDAPHLQRPQVPKRLSMLSLHHLVAVDPQLGLWASTASALNAPPHTTVFDLGVSRLVDILPRTPLTLTPTATPAMPAFALSSPASTAAITAAATAEATSMTSPDSASGPAVVQLGHSDATFSAPSFTPIRPELFEVPTPDGGQPLQAMMFGAWI
jgi:hypothetical protein